MKHRLFFAGVVLALLLLAFGGWTVGTIRQTTFQRKEA